MTPTPPKILKLSDVPAYVEKQTGQKVTRQTVYNWRKYGKYGAKLETRKTLKGFYTTEKWVDDFLARI